jgi:formyltetrahydrofolate-dependent phosphoribosylglycinamide formyltransferase
MFQRLQQKWKVSSLQVLLILCTFAIGGSLTGFAGKKLMNLVSIEQRGFWLLVYILIVTILWPFSVLLVSVFFGQYKFFTNYLRKMGKRMGIVGRGGAGQDGAQTARLAVFASGAGSNAQKIIDRFRHSATIKVSLIICNKPGAGVLDIAKSENIPFIIIEKEKFFRDNGYADELREAAIDLIVLAGFLWKIPSTLIDAYPGRIVNIHPALLPNYGGKGMYGHHVHEAVIAGGEKESGITIHYVDGHYDNGDIIFQARCAVMENDTPVTLASRIHQLEHEHYSRIIEELINKSFIRKQR